MKNKGVNFIPISKVFKIINSCTTHKQLKSCYKLAKNYTNLLKSKGVINYDILYKDIIIKIRERRNELILSNSFKGSIKRRKRVEIKQTEKELIEYFY